MGMAAVVLWSTTIGVSRSIAQAVGPLTAGAAVFTLGAFLAFALGRARRPAEPERIRRRFLLWCGLLFATYELTLYIAIGLVLDGQQLLEIGLINYLWPVLTVLCALPVLGLSVSWVIVPGIALALVGIALVTTHAGTLSLTALVSHLQGNPVAYVSALVAALTWALYSVLSRKWGPVGPHNSVAWFMLASALALWVGRAWAGEVSHWTLRAALETAFMGVATSVAYWSWDIGVRNGDFGKVSVFSYLTPLFSTVVSCLYLGIGAGMRLWIGALLIVAGAWLSRAAARQRAARPRAA